MVCPPSYIPNLSGDNEVEAQLYLPKTLEGYYNNEKTEPHSTFTFTKENMTVQEVYEKLEAETKIPAKYWTLIDPDCVDDVDNFQETFDAEDLKYLSDDDKLEPGKQHVICCLKKAVYRVKLLDGSFYCYEAPNA